MLGRYIRPHTGVHLVRFQFDQHVTACAMHGKILWLLGFPDKAKLVIERNIDDALACGHQASLFYALAVTACPVALFLGDLVAAENYTAMLMSRASQYGLEFWHTHGRCFEGILNIRHGKIQAGLRLLETTIKALPRTNFMTRYAAFLSELAEALVRAGELAHGLAMIDRALQMSEQSGERWCVPEMLRMKGEILLQDRALAPSDPEDIFLRSLDLARNQGALSWELRSAMSLARFRRDQGNRLSALELLRSTYGRFTEGFSSTDLKAAKILLFELAQP
jgi:predicted ATPase